LAFFDGCDVVEVEAGAANVSNDFEGALASIKDCLDQLTVHSKRSWRELVAAPTFAGLAGVLDKTMAAKVAAKLPFDHAVVSDDQTIALRGLLGERDGYVAHCGTGSFFGKRIGNTAQFAGGWGPALGDEASACWVGRAALSLCLYTIDGRRRPSPLSKRLLKELGSGTDMVSFAKTAEPLAFAETAPLITEYAKDGDALAVEIMRCGAQHISRALKALGWTTGQPVCLAGGIGAHYAPFLPSGMRDGLVPPAGRPIDGAISLARDLTHEVRQFPAWKSAHNASQDT